MKDRDIAATGHRVAKTDVPDTGIPDKPGYQVDSKDTLPDDALHTADYDRIPD